MRRTTPAGPARFARAAIRLILSPRMRLRARADALNRIRGGGGGGDAVGGDFLVAKRAGDAVDFGRSGFPIYPRNARETITA